MPPAERIRRKAAAIRLAAFDADGVLTDGGIYFGETGEEYKCFNVQDGLGLVMLREAGIEVAVISSRTSAAVARRMSGLGIRHVLQGVSDKKQALTNLARDLGIENTALAFVGDDLIDLPVMAICGLSVAVANARPEVQTRADWITTAPGGRGGVREVCELLLAAQGKMEGIVKKLVGLD
jgi:3-deoxy-D-manno-octulosonate 8-phosphate phosphatase (KDO 8-P phosphatase)